MIVVTGGAGFIGSNIVAGLNARVRHGIIIVDDMRDGGKCRNLADLAFADYYEHDDSLARIEADAVPDGIEVILQQGACSDTTEWDGRFVMARNFTYSQV